MFCYTGIQGGGARNGGDLESDGSIDYSDESASGGNYRGEGVTWKFDVGDSV